MIGKYKTLLYIYFNNEKKGLTKGYNEYKTNKK